MPTIQILVIILSAVAWLNAAADWWLYKRYAINGTLFWAIGTAFVGLGVSSLALQGHISPYLSVLFANTAIGFGYALVWEGMRRFCHKTFSPLATVFSIAVICAGSMGIYHYYFETQLLLGRIVASSLVILVYSVAIANTLLATRLDQTIVTMTGTAYSINAIVVGSRLLITAVTPSASAFLFSGKATIFFLVFSIIFTGTAAVGQVLMVLQNKEDPDLLTEIRA